ncbi:hypothetical protein [Paraburkholderia sp. GAS348]|uniref:hypothetical protein n=1 Tax=Paraburkholderia sp. GAS348 TaxID=3035132 RepID=UPI003D20A2F8
MKKTKSKRTTGYVEAIYQRAGGRCGGDAGVDQRLVAAGRRGEQPVADARAHWFAHEFLSGKPFVRNRLRNSRMSESPCLTE